MLAYTELKDHTTTQESSSIHRGTMYAFATFWSRESKRAELIIYTKLWHTRLQFLWKTNIFNDKIAYTVWNVQ